MMSLNYATALKNAEHLIALGQRDVYIHADPAFPFDKVTTVEVGGSYRLNGPSSAYFIFTEAGLRFRMNVDFESREANGRGVSMFDRDTLRDVISKLSPIGRREFAKLLSGSVLDGLAERTNELREALRVQADSEDCVRGLISFAERSK